MILMPWSNFSGIIFVTSYFTPILLDYCNHSPNHLQAKQVCEFCKNCVSSWRGLWGIISSETWIEIFWPRDQIHQKCCSTHASSLFALLTFVQNLLSSVAFVTTPVTKDILSVLCRPRNIELLQSGYESIPRTSPQSPSEGYRGEPRSWSVHRYLCPRNHPRHFIFFSTQRLWATKW